MRQLGDRKDEDQVEEQFGHAHPAARCAVRAQQQACWLGRSGGVTHDREYRCGAALACQVLPCTPLRDGAGIRAAGSSLRALSRADDLHHLLAHQPPPPCAHQKAGEYAQADFQPHTSHVLAVKAPGPMAADPGELPWKRLGVGIRPRP